MQRMIGTGLLYQGRNVIRSLCSLCSVHTLADDLTSLEPPRKELDFSDDTSAYQHKSSWSIFRSMLILHLCRVPVLVNSADSLIRNSRRILGNKFTDSVIRHSFFHQFCAAERQTGAIEKALELHERGIGGMLDCGASTPPPGASQQVLESIIAVNIRDIKEAIKSAGFTSSSRKVAIKPTTLVNPESLENITSLLGTLQGPLTSIPSFQKRLNTFTELLKNQSNVDDRDIKELMDFESRLGALVEFSMDYGVQLMIDAEESEVQPAIDLVVLSLMEKYNNDSKAWILTTYQCYLLHTYNRLIHDLETFASSGKVFGVKLVRGAYMKHEQKKALEMNVQCPVFKLKTQTDATYDQATRVLLKRLHQGQSIEICLATHNENSVRNATAFMTTNRMDPKNTPVHFAQLYGMSDYLTYTLAHHGYNSMKLLVYGDIHNIIPYLIRRAQENGDVLGGSSRDLKAMRSLLSSRWASNLHK
eukprot:g2346.t1